jgi:hypothetical protein
LYPDLLGARTESVKVLMSLKNHIVLIIIWQENL